MRLTPNFTDDEFKVSESKPDLAEQMVLTDEDRTKMFYLCAVILQPVRNIFGGIKILSGIRYPALNKAIGGSKNSDHLYTAGTPKAAADFTPLQAQIRDVYDHIKTTRAGAFGQLILYTKSNFIHVSLPTERHIGEYFEWAK